MNDPTPPTGSIEEIRPGGEPLEPLPPPGGHDSYSALRTPNYRRFAAGFTSSSIGLQMLVAAISWEVYLRTRDPFALGLIGFARALPVLFLTLPAGHIADICDRRIILILTQAAFALLAAALAAASYLHAPIWVLLAIMMLTGCVRSFNGPARSSLLPAIVPAHVFENAVAWNSGVFQFAAIAGPFLASGIIAATGVVWPVYIGAAIGCVLFALSATAIHAPAAPRPAGGAPRFTLAGMFDGMSHVWREKTILAAITLDLFAVLLGGATALLPIYAQEILHVGEFGYGALRAAPFAGALLMAILLAHLPPFKRAGLALLLSVAGFGLCTIVFGYSTWFPLSLVMLVLLGAFDNVSVVIRHILVQMRTPDHLRGRVSAVNTVFIESSNELGAFRSGVFARAFGPVASVAAGGVGTILVVLGVAFLWPEVRRLGRLVEPRAPGRPGAEPTGAAPAAAAADSTASPPGAPPIAAPSGSPATPASTPAAGAATAAP